MSTLLTPIITQMNIDRERLRQLINGDVNDTVQLEFRIEKSIAGMVKERIDLLAFSLQEFVDQATDAAIEANKAERAATATKEAVEGIKDEIDTQVQQASNSKEAAVVARNEAEEFAKQAKNNRDDVDAIIATAGTQKPSSFGIDLIKPASILSENVLDLSSNNFSIIAEPFNGNSDRIKFIGRQFELYNLNTSDRSSFVTVEELIENNIAVEEINETILNLEYYIGNQTHDDNLYAARVTDSYISLDEESKNKPRNKIKTQVSLWTIFKFNDTKQSISRPTLEIVGGDERTDISPNFTTTIPTVVGGGSITHTYFRILDEDLRVVYDELVEGTTTTFTVPKGILKFNRTYKAQSQSIIETSNPDDMPDMPAIYSPFSEFVTFKTNEDISYLPYYNTKSTSTSGVIDVEDSSVYRIDGSTNRIITLSKPTLPNNIAQNIIVFIEDSGGTITWPTEVSWSGGSEPVLGTSWTNVILFWTGSMWIGMEGAKR